MYYRSVSCTRSCNVKEKLFTVSRTFENFLSFITSGGNMIESSWVFYPQRPGHVFTHFITTLLYNIQPYYHWSWSFYQLCRPDPLWFLCGFCVVFASAGDIFNSCQSEPHSEISININLFSFMQITSFGTIICHD